MTWALILFSQLLRDMAPVGVLARGLLVEGGEGDDGNSNFDAMALLGLQLCVDLLAVGDQDFMASPSSSALEPQLLAPSLLQHTATQCNVLK